MLKAYLWAVDKLLDALEAKRTHKDDAVVDHAGNERGRTRNQFRGAAPRLQQREEKLRVRVQQAEVLLQAEATRENYGRPTAR